MTDVWCVFLRFFDGESSREELNEIYESELEAMAWKNQHNTKSSLYYGTARVERWPIKLKEVND